MQRRAKLSKKKRLGRQGFERLEDRICLTLETMLSNDGDLIVTGAADGNVEIVALSEDSYQVTDNGEVVSVVEGVVDDVRVNLDASEGSSEIQGLSIDLGGNEIDRLAVRGAGETGLHLQVSNGSSRFLGVHVGAGDDEIQVAESLDVTGGACMRLGDGNNQVNVEGHAQRLSVHGGDGADDVTLGEMSSVERVYAKLGDGDNSLVISGEAGEIFYHGGDGADRLLLDELATAHSLRARLGDGDNTIAVAGEVEGRVVALAGSGVDQLLIGSEANIGGSVIGMLGEGDDIVETQASSQIAADLLAALGAGDNGVALNGDVGGDVVIRSDNATDEDRIEITGEVAGEIDSQPGVAASPEDGFSGLHGGRRGLRGRLGSLLGGLNRLRRNC